MGKVTSRTDPRSEARITPMHIVPVSIDDLPSDQCTLILWRLCFIPRE